MKKLFTLFLIICLLVISLCGCGPDTTTSNLPSPTDSIVSDYVKPTILENYFELICENSDITLYSNAVHGFLLFPLISARDLNGVDIYVKSNIGETVSKTITVVEEPTQMPAHVFLAYQGFDWISLKGDRNTYREKSAPYQSAYNETYAELPSLYLYVFSLSFEDLGFNKNAEQAVQKIDTLSITIDGQTKTYFVGNIQLLSGKSVLNQDCSGLSLTPLAISDFPCNPTADGKIKMSEFHINVNENITIQDIVIPGTEIVEECGVSITTASGDKYSMRWDCHTPFDADIGSKISLSNIIIQDPVIKDKLYSTTMRYMTVNYSMNDENYCQNTEVLIRMRQDPFDIYALKVDGIDTLSYYLDYINYAK